MNHPRHDLSRTKFQLERFLFFSDAVFAISITLLIIAIKVPDRDEMNIYSDAALWKYLSHNSLKFFGFFISFGIIAHYWSVHHRIFGYAINYSTSLIWINFGYLFSVVLLPFSSGLLGAYASDTSMVLPYAIYVGNLCFTACMNIWLWLYISNPKHNLLTHKISKARIRLGLHRSLMMPIVFLISLLLSFFLPIISRFVPIIIPFVLHSGMKGMERRADEKDKDELMLVSKLEKQ